MSEKKPRYITTTLPYVNADPHIGFALEIVQADSVARYWRGLGYDVFFNTGTDEHGQKIAHKADAAEQSRQEYVDYYAGEFDKLKVALNLSYDRFIRTSSQSHQLAAQALWQRCNEKGDIYKKKYTGLYCIGCESFKIESDLVDGLCPDHKTAPEQVEEENYFFRLSRYQTELAALLSDPKRTIPDWQRRWALDFVHEGLEDLSISRHISRVDWGVPVPDDAEQVMYVWFDALTNYISTLGWPDDTAGDFQKFWVDGETVQVAGKDQVRFQSIIFQAMLLSADLPTTDTIFYHGFINSGGHKMSKSLGNVISPYEMVERYGTDATRYILLRHTHPTEDSDVTWEKMDEWYTAHLVNGLGNLTSRIMKMAETHLDEPVARPESAGFPDAYSNALDAYEFQSAMDMVWHKIAVLDEKITTTEPFKLVKTDPARGREVIAELVRDLYQVGVLLYPIVPHTSHIISQAVVANHKPDNLFSRLDS